MAPNLVVATKTLFSPHKWFTPAPCVKSERRTEHWNQPVPGTYQYVPGRGWSLIAIDHPSATLNRPIPVRYSQVLKRSLLIDEYNDRKCVAEVKLDNGKIRNLGFFRLDNETAWVNYLDAEGDFVPGPYKLWCIDEKTGTFRTMLKGDDPARRSRQSSRAPSISPSHSQCNNCASRSTESLVHPKKCFNVPMSPWATTPAPSRPVSIRLQSMPTTPSLSPEHRSRTNSSTPTLSPTTPGEILSDPMELSRRLTAIKQKTQPT